MSNSLLPYGLYPLSIGFSRQEYWSGLPCPAPSQSMDLNCGYDALFLGWVVGICVFIIKFLFLSPYVDIYVAFKCFIYMHIFIYATLKYNICIAFTSWQTLFQVCDLF